MSLSTIKNAVVNKVSDAMSYPARRAAQKSILNSNRNLSILNNRSAADKANYKWSIDPDGELNAAPQARQKAALGSLGKAVGKAMPLNQGYKIPKTPSNGVGVGGN